MEEKKIVMPPPPKELKNMPPPPPPPPAKNENNVAEKPVENANFETVEIPGKSVSDVQKVTENVEQEKVETKKKKEKPEKAEKVKHKASGGMKTFLYWLGFIVSLGTLGILIYLLVK